MVRICLTLFVFAVMARHSSSAMDNPKTLERIIRLEYQVKGLNRRLEEISDELKAERGIGKLVAFSAYNPLDRYPLTNRVIRFGVDTLNEGNYYNPVSGVFIAPFDGLYQFSAHICNTPVKYIVYAIVCNENELAVSTQWDDTYSCGSVTALGMVKAGEKVSVKCTYCQAGVEIHENVHRRNSFTGVLLQQKQHC